MSLTSAQLKRLRRTNPGPTKNRLRVARHLLKLNQAELAEQIGMSQPSLSDFERQGNAIRLENAQKFADFYGCAIEDLFPVSQEATS